MSRIRRIRVGSDEILYWILCDPSMGLFDLGRALFSGILSCDLAPTLIFRIRTELISHLTVSNSGELAVLTENPSPQWLVARQPPSGPPLTTSHSPFSSVVLFSHYSHENFTHSPVSFLCFQQNDAFSNIFIEEYTFAKSFSKIVEA
ncbi:unnamed protein product [Adineta ricciae]|uniref:Uncharacterized protein n=1 Tax=Adineta ricciae TaxID=249248 RepID=A0A814CBT6_ADIRI|nr:unnamed protein product [Adineta ricciae]